MVCKTYLIDKYKVFNDPAFVQDYQSNSAYMLLDLKAYGRLDNTIDDEYTYILLDLNQVDDTHIDRFLT